MAKGASEARPLQCFFCFFFVFFVCFLGFFVWFLVFFVWFLLVFFFVRILAGIFPDVFWGSLFFLEGGLKARTLFLFVWR